MRPFDAMLAHPTFFSVSRRSVAGAIWIGVFIALIPLPGQTLLALLAAMALRVNLPVAGITTWITNPITMVPFFYWEYGLGTLILELPIEDWKDFQVVGNGRLREVWRPKELGDSSDG